MSQWHKHAPAGRPFGFELRWKRGIGAVGFLKGRAEIVLPDESQSNGPRSLTCFNTFDILEAGGGGGYRQRRRSLLAMRSAGGHALAPGAPNGPGLTLGDGTRTLAEIGHHAYRESDLQIILRAAREWIDSCWQVETSARSEAIS